MKEEIHLEDLVPFLDKTLIKINYRFFKKLIINASTSEKPWKNENFAEKISCPYLSKKEGSRTIYAWMKNYEKRAISFSYLRKIVELSSYNWLDVEKNFISIRSSRYRGKIYLKFPIKINKEMGAIVGHILGDGSIDAKYNAVFFSNSNIELLKEFRNDMKIIFDIEPRIWVQKKRKFEEKSKWLKRVDNLKDVPGGYPVGLFYPKICTVILHAIIGEFALGKKKKITKQILNQNLEFKRYLVRAFFDDEGSVSSNSYTIRFFQDNKEILEDIRRLIKDFGINTHELKSYIKRNKIRYYFNLTGFKEYYRFYYSIGCTSPNKNKELLLLINKVKDSRYFKKKYAL